ncbi:MAG: exo-alpha-sialidase [Candidatus Latescibacteria bacterium]|jgi:sialidase-1|nr:exo-alpha-sialidase [Candidatus Latescibacterota bacterium]MBT4138159.1 exo-alpha-sialidase [Candidatus Latescibacterota bacterium]
MNDSERNHPNIQIVDQQTTVLAPATDEFSRNMGGDIIRLQDGRLFLAYSQWFGGTHDRDSSRVVGQVSQDDGETWGDSFVIAEPNAGRDVVRMPSLIRLGDGRLALFARCHQTMLKKWVIMMICEDESGDLLDASVWTAPQNVTPEGPGGHVLIAQRVIRTQQGRIVVPVAAPWPWDREDDKTDDIRTCCMLSDDDGETWRVSQSILAGPKRGFMEPCVLELGGGRLMMLLRTQVSHQYVSYSEDGGDVWTPAVAVDDLVSPESPAALARVPNTDLTMVVWNHNPNDGKHSSNRSPLTVGFSKDEGQTWFGFHNLEAEPDRTWSYPSIQFLDGKAAVIYYDRIMLPSGDTRISLKMQKFGVHI